MEYAELDLVRVFKALGNETRLAIFNYIRGPEYDCGSDGRDGCEVDSAERTVCVSHVARKFGSMGQAAISQHLKHLHEAGLLDRHKAGPWVYYTISAPTVSLIRQFFDGADIPQPILHASEKPARKANKSHREPSEERIPIP